MLCPNCGNQCKDDAQFCTNCGAAIAAAAAEEPVVETVAEPVVEATPVCETEVVNSEPKKESIITLILGIAAVVINSGLGCLCGCLGSFPGIVCAVIGLVLGFKERKNYVDGVKNKKNEIGIILCFVALGLVVVFTILNTILGGLTAMVQSGEFF